jgi:hypothetical protein
MLNYDTFLTAVYVEVDEFCKSHPALLARLLRGPGEATALTPAETATLAIFGQWGRFRTERDFYRFAEQKLRPLFPTLPARTQFNRSQRRYSRLITAFFQHMARVLGARESPYEILDRTGVKTRASGRRGGEWLHGQANKGWCSRLGYFHGLQLMCAVTHKGVITGFGVGPATGKDQPMAGDFLALRHAPDDLMPWVGEPAAAGTYVLDKGFSGRNLHVRWAAEYDAHAVCAPQRGHGPPWPRRWRRWLAGLRQIIETVHDKLHNCFRLERERPHTLQGIFARLSAKAALHNVCIWLNRQLGRPDLAFCDLLAW